MPAKTSDHTGMAERLAKHLDLTPEQIKQVLVAQEAAQTEGPPLGTVLRNEKLNAVAHRVELNGQRMWAVSNVEGNQWTDTNPDLDADWTRIYP